MGKWIEKIYRLLPKDISKKKCTQIGYDHCCVVLWTSGVRFLINFRDKIIYTSSFLKTFGICRSSGSGFQKIDRITEALVPVFWKKKYNHQKNIQFWVYFENCWSRIWTGSLIFWEPLVKGPVCVLVNPTH
jgi:hypothetical protein